MVLDTPSTFGAGSVHSIYKQPTGARLSWGARAVAYGDAEVQAAGFTGPVPESVQVSTAGTVSITFSGFDGDLEVRTEQGFEVYMGGAWRSASIGGHSGRTVVLQGAWVGASHLRYLWADAARPAFFASRSVRRALLTPQVNPESRYRCCKST